MPEFRIGRPVHAASLACASANADTFLYLGSDLDVQALLWLAPSETHAVFLDNFGSVSDSGTGESGMTRHQFSRYEEQHQSGSESRASYREHSGILREMPRGSRAREEKLSTMMESRLRDTPDFSMVRRVSTLKWSFEYANVSRTLRFAQSDLDSLLQPDNPNSLAALGLCSRISTYVHLAFGHAMLPELLLALAPPGATEMRFIVGAESAQEVNERLKSVHGATSSTSWESLPYRAVDAFAATAEAYALCLPVEHSFDLGMQQLGAMLGSTDALAAVAGGAPPQPALPGMFDVFDAFEPQHRHHHQRSASGVRLTRKLRHLHRLLGAPDASELMKAARGLPAFTSHADAAALDSWFALAPPAHGHVAIINALDGLARFVRSQPCTANAPSSHAADAWRKWFNTSDPIRSAAGVWWRESMEQQQRCEPFCLASTVPDCEGLGSPRDCSACVADGGFGCFPGAVGWPEHEEL